MTSETELLLHMKNGNKIVVGFPYLIQRLYFCYNKAMAPQSWCQTVPGLAREHFYPQYIWVAVVTIEVLPGREHATSARGLKSFALMVWRKIIPSYLKSLTETMQKHKKAVVDAQKSHKKYGKHLGIVFCMIY